MGPGMKLRVLAGEGYPLRRRDDELLRESSHLRRCEVGDETRFIFGVCVLWWELARRKRGGEGSHAVQLIGLRELRWCSQS
jgi:hypothetical protein